MGIRIFHTGDPHVGMRFNKYPEDIETMLREAGIEVIERMVAIANIEGCNIFVVASDLFDKNTCIDKKSISTIYSFS